MRLANYDHIMAECVFLHPHSVIEVFVIFAFFTLWFSFVIYEHWIFPSIKLSTMTAVDFFFGAFIFPHWIEKISTDFSLHHQISRSENMGVRGQMCKHFSILFAEYRSVSISTTIFFNISRIDNALT